MINQWAQIQQKLGKTKLTMHIVQKKHIPNFENVEIVGFEKNQKKG